MMDSLIRIAYASAFGVLMIGFLLLAFVGLTDGQPTLAFFSMLCFVATAWIFRPVMEACP